MSEKRVCEIDVISGISRWREETAGVVMEEEREGERERKRKRERDGCLCGCE